MYCNWQPSNIFCRLAVSGHLIADCSYCADCAPYTLIIDSTCQFRENVFRSPRTFWSIFVVPRLIRIGGISPRDETDSVMRARQKLDDELAAMHLAMCSIRTRRNALCPISSLPAELLARIFEFHAAAEPPSFDDERLLGWIEVTHVCRLWRDTAMQFPSLWSDICFDLGTQWAEVMLARTKEASVSLRRHLTHAPHRSTELISKHVRHARELSLSGPLDVLERYICTLPSSLRTLERMELRTDYSDFMFDSFKLPEAMVGCHLPSLRRLSLRGLWVPWSAPFLRGLTYLEVQLREPELDGPTTEEYLHSSHQMLFDVLKAMPTLETLILKHCFPLGPWEDGRSERLHLPRMGVLHLEGSPVACFGIAKRLQIPGSCQVWLRCSGDNTNIDEILPFLVAHVNGGAGLPLWQTLLISALFNEECRLHMWRVEDALKNEEDKFDPVLQPDFAVTFYNPEQTLRPLKSLCQALPLQTIRTAHAFICPTFSNRDWIEILGQYTSITKAYISGYHSMSFCRALCKTTDRKSVVKLESCPREKLFLGKLEFLHLENVDFRSWWINKRGTSQWFFTRWLKERLQVKGAPMLGVDLQECSIEKDWVGKLRTVAAFVRWDEFEGECAVEIEPEEDYLDSDEPEYYFF